MITVVILALVVVVFLLFLIFQVWRHYFRTVEAAVTQLTPVDLEAFENLIDPEEELFLKANLSPSEFRGVQLTRIRAAKAYVAVLSENARVLVAAGQSARYHSDPEIAAAAAEIVQRAIKLKLWCLFALLRLDAGVFFPARLAPASGITRRYFLVTSMAASLLGKSAA